MLNHTPHRSALGSTLSPAHAAGRAARALRALPALLAAPVPPAPLASLAPLLLFALLLAAGLQAPPAAAATAEPTKTAPAKAPAKVPANAAAKAAAKAPAQAPTKPASKPATKPGAKPAAKLAAKPAPKPVAPAVRAAAAAAPAPVRDTPAGKAAPHSGKPIQPLMTVAAFCAEAARRLPNLPPALCTQSHLVDSQARSVLGHPLWQRDVAAPEPKWRVLVIGGIHGDEPSSVSLVFHWMRLAASTPSDIHWRFVPLVNPDGVLRSQPTRTNARGVDLNRNFPTQRWNTEAPEYWLKRTGKDPRRYPGPAPLSEPETKWLYEEMERWKPHLVVSVHAPYGVLDFDGPAVPPQRLGRLYLDQVGIFPGSLGNWSGVTKRVPVVTIELHSALRTPLDAEMRQMWLDLLRWISERLK